MTKAHIEGNVPHVYTGLANILKELGVAKGGTLPANMGGKPYITAVDVAREVKTLFVANDLIFLPTEKVHKHEVVIHKDRVNVAVIITGEYTIVSLQDGSQVVVSGTGDGLAGGTAVASNIASTNALKNALLRTFLITEQSVEDAAKEGLTSADAPATKDRRTIAAAASAAKPAAEKSPLDIAKDKVQAWIGGDEAKRATANAAQARLKAEGNSGLGLLLKLIAEVGA